LVALDDEQYETGEGPCLEVLDPHEPISLDDASEPDDRWQHFARTAEHLGIRSSLSMHLPVESDGLAASVNLYSHIHKALGEDEIAAAVPFADQLATAIQSVDAHRSTAKLAQNMAEAMRSRAVIEQAKGMLMAEKHIDADAAFQMLVRLSQHANVKLRDVAGRIVMQRSTPD
jgi:GAF domain-containing protein